MTMKFSQDAFGEIKKVQQVNGDRIFLKEIIRSLSPFLLLIIASLSLKRCRRSYNHRNYTDGDDDFL
uniref:Uncharacterized protein n=1 Tax=Octopus bimaculoides TaxID=37653 RepID=A0A0L8FT65_OCTBM